MQGGIGRKRLVDRRIGRVGTPTAGGPVSNAELPEGGTTTDQRIGCWKRCRVGRRGRVGWICRRRIALRRPAPDRRGEADREPGTARSQSPRLVWHTHPEKGVTPYGPPDSRRRDPVAQDPDALPAYTRNRYDEPRAPDPLRGDVAKVEYQAVPAHAHGLEPPSGTCECGCCCHRRDEQTREMHTEPGRVRNRGPPIRGSSPASGAGPNCLIHGRRRWTSGTLRALTRRCGKLSSPAGSRGSCPYPRTTSWSSVALTAAARTVS